MKSISTIFFFSFIYVVVRNDNIIMVESRFPSVFVFRHFPTRIYYMPRLLIRFLINLAIKFKMVVGNEGQQEYSSRQAGITSGIILGCLVPILMIIICIAVRALRSRRIEREQEEAEMR